MTVHTKERNKINKPTRFVSGVLTKSVIAVLVWLVAGALSVLTQGGNRPNRVVFSHYDYTVSTDPVNPHKTYFKHGS